MISFLWPLHRKTTNLGLKSTSIHLPSLRPLVLENRHLRSWCPSCLFQLLGAPGVHPWAGGRLPPVSASISTWLLRCVPVSFLSYLSTPYTRLWKQTSTRVFSKLVFLPFSFLVSSCHGYIFTNILQRLLVPWTVNNQKIVLGWISTWLIPRT